jgi:serine acetyltransferase
MAPEHSISDQTYISPRAVIGRRVLIGTGVKIYGNARIGDDSWIDSGVAIGYPGPGELRAARSVADDFESLDALLDSAASRPTVIGMRSFVRTGAVLYHGVTTGPDLDCAHQVIVREGCHLGSAVELGPFAYLKRDCQVGYRSRVASELCDRTIVGAHCTVYGRTSHRFLVGVSGAVEDAPAIKDGVVIGREAVVIGPVEVGELSFVGAGAVVTTSIKPESVALGNPARVVRRRESSEAPDLWARVRPAQ